jgi:hypothetical protein
MVLRRRRFGVRWLDTALDHRATIPVFSDSKRRRNAHQKNDNHCQRDDELGQHGANVPEQTSPPGPASVNHAFTRDDFTGDRANHRTNEQADQTEEQSDQRPQNRAERSPFRCAEMLRAEIASQCSCPGRA